MDAPLGATEIVAEAEAEGLRLDQFLCRLVPTLGRATARRVIEAGQVRVNGRAGAAGQRLSAGDVLDLAPELELAGEPIAALPDPAVPLILRHEDAWLLCADKPAGMPSHPLRPGELGTLASALLARFPELAAVGYSPREPGIVHRLDTDTSGLMLAARDAETFALLRGQLDRAELDKRYLALCAGRVGRAATHTAHLSARGPRVRVESAAFGSSEPIVTEILETERAGDFTLVTVRVHRARRHQIRAHLAQLGHPIAGDALYGGPPLPGLARHFLHAEEIHFTHPRTRAALSLLSPLPVELERALQSLR